MYMNYIVTRVTLAYIYFFYTPHNLQLFLYNSILFIAFQPRPVAIFWVFFYVLSSYK